MLAGDGVLVGRGAELHRLAPLVDAASSGGRGPAVAVVRGEPGIGRTALLAGVAAEAEAAGMRVLPLSGAVAEHGLEHAALADLLLPLRPFVDDLAPVQRSMLLACLALRPPLRPGPADELMVCRSAHTVLAAAGAHTPLLVLVDDLQWVDPASRRVLLYVARRLAGERVAVLLAHRDAPGGAGPATGLDGIPELSLGGLDDDACRELVRRAGGHVPDGLDPAKVTGGNPQALHDGLAAGRWDPLELGPALRRPWTAALRALPSRTRTALAALTATPSATAAELAPALGALGLRDGDLEPARRAGLLRRGPAARGAADVAHPLLGAAVRAAVPVAVRARVLRVLTAHADGDLHTAPATGDGLRATAVRVAALVLAGREREARAAIPATVPTGQADPWALLAAVLLAQSLVWIEDADAARRVLGPVLEGARAAAGPVLAHALVVRAELDWQRGAWPSAHAAAAEAMLRAGADGAAVGPALAALARVDAARGDFERCRERLERAVRAARPGPVLPIRVPAVHGLAALGAGEVDSAVAHLEQAWGRAGQDGLRGADAVAVAADLAEALVRSGRPDRAAPVVAWLRARAEGSGLVGPAAAAARCEGLLAADPESAAGCFAAAHRALGRADLPFEQARTLLLEGETLRRLRRPTLARVPLRAAAARFTGLGAHPWRERAERELGATGARAPSAADPEPVAADVTSLSPQELRIARTVAEGLNNAEAAAALYLSRKTVEAHLTRIYRKLGVRSRTDLVRLLG
ncbi:hypothetical protein GCM10009609_27730 [Pseudonocardia aurantiaca]|uniref:LuxR family transcriptional regulator n=1 Tax=Pseudonocardia aurantiaca TaxID=75290 RepID=A0ABW4FIJ7_9PSEU